jgi:hypothetical protein
MHDPRITDKGGIRAYDRELYEDEPEPVELIVLQDDTVSAYSAAS